MRALLTYMNIHEGTIVVVAVRVN